MKTHPSFNTIAIVGVGLIGGSLGLAIRRRYPSVEIIGVDKPSVLLRARRKGAITKGEKDLRKGLEKADLVIVATPLPQILRLLPRIARSVSPAAIVTDVGSVKGPVMRVARKHFRGSFIGGHPMAGTEISGIDAAHPLLFENALYILTPAGRTGRSLIRKLGGFFAELGARPVVMRPEPHDEVAAAVSHLPQLTAVTLMTTAGKRHPTSRKRLGLAAGGFRDLTRIASSRYDLWQSILSLNRREIVKSIDLFLAEWRQVRTAVARGRAGDLKRRFALAGRLRRSIPRDMKGFLSPLAAIQVFVPDKPGKLARLTAVIARHGLNIKDIELMKTREGTGGTFRLSFDKKETAERAGKVLRKSGFETAE